MGSLKADLRFGLRSIRREPGFFAMAIAILALGIGATGTVFSLVNAVLLRPLPYPDPGSLYLIGGEKKVPPTSRAPLSLPTYNDIHGAGAFASTGASGIATFNLTDGSGAERVDGARVTPSLLATLGVAPFLGRGFTEAEGVPNGPDVALLTHSFWKARFGGDASIVGRTVGLDGKRFQVVGVLPPGMTYPRREVQIWVPYQARTPELNRGAMGMRPLARLRNGWTIAKANAELDAAARRLAKAYPDTDEGWTYRLYPLREEIVGDVRRTLWILQTAAALLLAIACVNVANLLLVRGAGRGAEIAIRSALGAGRRRIVGQFLTESLIIALAAGTVGVLAAAGAVRLLQRLPGKVLPRAEELSVDARVLFFALLVSVLTALVFGIVPALRASERTMGASLKSGRRGSAGARDRQALRALVVAEVALAVLLTTGAGLLLRSFLLVQRVQPGFDAGSLWTATVGLAPARYPDQPRQERYFREARERLASVRGIESVAVVGRLPFFSFIGWSTFMVKGQPVPNGSEPHADSMVVSPGYFQTLRIPMLAGRDFIDRDDANAPHVAIVNRALAARYWPRESALGKRIQTGFDLQDYREIVGVVADVKLRSLEETPGPAIYLSLAQNAYSGHLKYGSFVARFAGPPATIASEARAALARYDAELAVTPFRPMAEVVSDSLSPRRMNLDLTLLFAGLAAILASVGIYGVMAHGVAQRRQEIGIRIALGAAKSDVMALVLGDGGLLAAVGIAIGLVASLPAARLLSGLLFGVVSGDPAVLGSVTVLVFAASGLAISVPARRAARLSPLEALR
jgi:putative ABC transport system permease protein